MGIGVRGDATTLGMLRTLRDARGTIARTEGRLATGARVRGAQDDAAALAVSNRLSAQVRGLNQAQRNAADLVSALRVADAALREQTEILQRMRELGVQAGNGVYTAADRRALAQEGVALQAELDAIVDKTTFNGLRLLDGGFTGRVFQLDATGSGEALTVGIEGARAQDLRIERIGASVATFEAFQSTAGATVSFRLNGVLVAYDAVDPADQAGNAAALEAALADPAVAAALGAQGISAALTSDGLGVSVTRADGGQLLVTDFDPGGPSRLVDTTLSTSVSGYLTQNRYGLDASTYLDGSNGPVGSLAATTSIVEATPNVGVAAVGNVAFTPSIIAVESDASGLVAGTTLEGWLGTSLEAGDQVDLALTDNAGVTTTLTYTLAGGDTLQDLVDHVNGAGAGFSASITGGRLRVEETSPTTGTSLAVSVQNYVDADSVGVTATFSGETFTASGEPLAVESLQGGLTLASGIAWVGTDLEAGDTFDVLLTRNDGTTAAVAYTVTGTDSVQDLRDAVNAAGVGFTASLAGGRLRIRETAPTLGTQLAMSFGNFVDANAASLAGALTAGPHFAATAEPLALTSGTAGLAAGTALTAWLGSGFEALDGFAMQLTRGDGTTAGPIAYTFTGTDTVQDVIDAINGAGLGFTASIVGGRLRVQESTPTDGGALALTFGGFVDEDPSSIAGTFAAPAVGRAIRRLESAGQLTAGAVTAATLLNDLNELSGLQGGDTLLVQLTDDGGVDRSFTFTMAGSLSGASTSTVGDLVTAIDAQSGVDATFDATRGILVTDSAGNVGGSLALSFGPAGFTEYVDASDDANATVPAALAFTTVGRSLETGALTVGGVATTLGTQLNQLDGFANLQGGDRIRIDLVSFEGATLTVELDLDDVAVGQLSARTVGDLVSLLDGQTLGTSTLTATLAATGAIQLTERSTVRAIGQGFEAGDTVDVVLGASDGTTTTLTYTFAGATDTWGDLSTFIGANSSFTATFENGRLAIEEDALAGSSSVSVQLSNYQDAGGAAGIFTGSTFQANERRAWSSFASPVAATTLLNDLEEFDGVHAGDAATFEVTSGSGAVTLVPYTFGGTAGELSTDTVGDLLAAIMAAAPGVSAYVELGLGQVVLEEAGLPTGLALGFRFRQADFQELAGTPIHHELGFTADSRSFGSATLVGATTSATVQAYAYDLSSQEAARVAIVTLDEAIRRQSENQARIGALLSRVESRIDVLSSRAGSLSVAQGNIASADVASEAASLVAARIVEAASVSMFEADRTLRRMAVDLLTDTLGRL